MELNARTFSWIAVVLGTLHLAGVARSQVAITEVMYEPGGADALWEWVEILNTTGAPVDLNGWVFDDDDDGAIGGAMGGANITASPNNNTVVPAGGVAVLYPGDELDFMPARFNNAWGGGITLIGVDGFTSLSAGDAIGLWPSRTSYDADAIPGATMSPRRTFVSAAASFNFATLDAAETGHSIAWNGTGNVADPANWAQSEEGVMGAFASEETTIANAQINSTDDRGNPGRLPPGPASAGLRMTEIMFAPDSPLVTVGYASDDFEWVEVFNNQPTAIDFAATNYVFDDIAGSKLSSANVHGGVLPAGGVGVLFNNERITIEQMQTMWGEGINFIPVERWPTLNNVGGDTIALWDSYSDYNSEPMTGSPRTTQNAVQVVTYNTVASQGWPTILNGSSIWLNNLSADPQAGANWTRAGSTGDTLSFNAQPISQTAIDHLGGDIGSPGVAPGTVAPTLTGDYNNNGVVDAADYVLWRNGGPLQNEGDTPGVVNDADYIVWRANFGRSLAATASQGGSIVPEPSRWGFFVFGATLAASLATGRKFMRQPAAAIPLSASPALRSPLQFDAP